jgi:hypothetical protein
MKHLKTFENFSSINEEELISIFGNAQKKIKDYTDDVLSGKFEMSEKLKKDIKKYISEKPDSGLGSAMSSWKSYIRNISKAIESSTKPQGQLQDVFGKKRDADEVIEEEIARVVLKDRLVVKVGGKWEIKGGRHFGDQGHVFGGGA